MPVNCQITVTIRIGGESGRMILRKMRQKPAPSMRAALIRSSGIVDVVVAAEQRREGEALHGVDQDQAGDRVGEAELAEDEGPGHQRDLARA